MEQIPKKQYLKLIIYKKKMLRDKNMSSSFKQFHKEYLMLKMYFNKSPVNTEN